MTNILPASFHLAGNCLTHRIRFCPQHNDIAYYINISIERERMLLQRELQFSKIHLDRALTSPRGELEPNVI